MRKTISFYTEQEEVEIFNKIINSEGNKRIQDTYVMEVYYKFEPLLKKLVNKMNGYNIDNDILFSEATVAFLEATRRYMPDKGFRFSTYLQSYVRGMLYTYIMKNYFSVNFCANSLNKKMFFSLRKDIKIIQEKLGIDTVTHDVIKELSALYNVDIDRIKTVLNVIDSKDLELNKVYTTEESSYMVVETIESDVDLLKDLLESSSDSIIKSVIDESLSQLSQRDKDIIIGQIYCEDEDMKTLSTIAEQYNISKERVRQLRDKSMIKLKNNINKTLKSRNLNYTDIHY